MSVGVDCQPKKMDVFRYPFDRKDKGEGTFHPNQRTEKVRGRESTFSRSESEQRVSSVDAIGKEKASANVVGY